MARIQKYTILGILIFAALLTSCGQGNNEEQNQSADTTETLEFCDVFGSIPRSGVG